MRLKKLFPLCCFLMAESAFSQAYFGLNHVSMDYHQPDVLTSTLGESEPPLNIIQLDEDYIQDMVDQGYAEEDVVRYPSIIDIDSHLTGMSIKLGYAFTNWLSVETRFGFGTSSKILEGYSEVPSTQNITVPNDDGFGNPINPDDPGAETIVRITDVTPADAEFLPKYTLGGYFRLGGQLRGERWISPYLLLGYTRGNFDVTASSGTGGGTFSSHSSGIGINFKMPWLESSAFNVEYMEQFSDGPLDVSTVSVGFEYFVN